MARKRPQIHRPVPSAWRFDPRWLKERASVLADHYNRAVRNLRSVLPLILLAAMLIPAAEPSADPTAPTVGRLAPEELESHITVQPELIPGIFESFADALAGADDAAAARLGTYLNAVTRARCRRLAAAGFTSNDTDLLLALQLVDLGRFVDDAGFRERVLALLPGALDPATPPRLRRQLLYRLQQLRGVDLEELERVALAWGAIARSSAERELSGSVPLALGDEEGTILASVYSLPSEFFTEGDAERFLAAVRRSAPERTLVVLADQPLHDALAASGLGLRLVETWGFPFTPWPRDPMTFMRAPDGRRVVLVRPPKRRQGRPEDSWLGRTLVQGLPDDLDRQWRLYWRRSSFPFHNGQILEAGGRLWITLHTLEIRVLDMLDLERVPLDGFAGPPGERYVAAARRAADELAELYGLPVSFVHPLPAADADPETRAAELRRLGGAARIDLDSVATLLPLADGGLAALVGDPGAGAELVGATDAAALDRFAAAYGLTPRGDELRRRLRAAQESPRARSLADFLDLVAGHLESDATVRRVPLLLVPRELEAKRSSDDRDFIVGWNNVVLERDGEAARAEGFAALLESGDDLAREVFGGFGYRLDLFPPLVESVKRSGGYRCASQHVR